MNEPWKPRLKDGTLHEDHLTVGARVQVRLSLECPFMWRGIGHPRDHHNAAVDGVTGWIDDIGQPAMMNVAPADISSHIYHVVFSRAVPKPHSYSDSKISTGGTFAAIELELLDDEER